MSNASQLSRRMIRGFAAALALIGGLQVVAYGLGTMLLAEERARGADLRQVGDLQALIARAALLGSDQADGGGRDVQTALAATAEAIAASSATPGLPNALDLRDFAAAARAISERGPSVDAAGPGGAGDASAELRARARALLASLDPGAASPATQPPNARSHAERVVLAGLLAGLGGLAIVALAILRPILGEVTRVTRALEETQEKLAHSALHDHLTGLPNRRYVEEHLRRVLAAAGRSGQMVAVLQVDLDGFKQINDRFGHAVGDTALASVARRMQSAIRRSDFLGRTGGDEFVVIAAETRNPRGLENLADRLISTVGEPIEVGCERCEIGASVGIALAPPLDADSERLLSHADAALYAAKAEGRGLFRFHPDARVYLDVHYPAKFASVMKGTRTG